MLSSFIYYLEEIVLLSYSLFFFFYCFSFSLYYWELNNSDTWLLLTDWDLKSAWLSVVQEAELEGFILDEQAFARYWCLTLIDSGWNSKHRGKINLGMALMWRAWFIKLPPQADVIKSRLELDVGFVALPRNLPQGEFTYLKCLKKTNRFADITFPDCTGDTKVIKMSWSCVGIGVAPKHRTSE